MIELTDGMLLYHGSYTSIPHIDLARCANGLDFGHGFYLTSSYEQAYNYVRLSVRKAIRIGDVPGDYDVADGQISVYRFHYDPNLLTHIFYDANIEWLHYVTANRQHTLFPELLRKYAAVDIVAGKIADDQTARTLQQYINAYDGLIPGTPEADTATIRKLLPNRLQDQLCYRTQDAVDSLEFIRSDRYGDIEL